MNENLQRKVNLMLQNAKILRKSAKLDFDQAANLGALLFTASNLVANERDIRANRKLLKQNTSVVSNFRGSGINLALLSRMSLKPDAASYLSLVKDAYSAVSAAKMFRSEHLVFTAMSMVEDCEPAQYPDAAQAAWDTYKKMRTAHPLLTGQEDLTTAHLLCNSGVDVDSLLTEAEQIYAYLKPTGFKLKKNTLQQVSLVLALSDKPVQQKCENFMALRDALRNAHRRIYGEELAVLAAFVDIDVPIERVVIEIGEVEDALKHNRGFGMLTGGNLRRLYASALCLQAYIEEGLGEDSAAGQAIATNVVVELIIEIIITIIMVMVISSSTSASSGA